MKIRDIYDFLNGLAPFDTAKNGDIVGLLVGSADARINKVLVVLDITAEVLDEAQRAGAGLIIAHHPVIYTPRLSFTDSCLAYTAAQKNIGVICVHTNLDVAPGGVNDCFISALGLKKTGAVEGTDGCAALVSCPERYGDPRALAVHVKEATGAGSVRLLNAGRPVKTAAVCCGGGSSFFDCVVSSGVDAFITGDLKYPQAVDAKRLGITLIDVGHYETEILFADPLIARLAERFPGTAFLRAASDRPFFEYI